MTSIVRPPPQHLDSLNCLPTINPSFYPFYDKYNFLNATLISPERSHTENYDFNYPGSKGHLPERV